MAVTSVCGLLSLLSEDEVLLKVHALENLDKNVSVFWTEISEHISLIESLSEDDSFPHQKLASLLASKVFYFLGDLSESLTYALGAGELFKVDDKSDTEFVNTLIATCIDQYIDHRRQQEESGEDSVEIDPRMVRIVEDMIRKCIADAQYHQAVGIAVECRRLDMLEESIKKSVHVPHIMVYTLTVAQSLVTRRSFRNSIYRLVVRLYEELNCPDWGNISQCLMFLDDAASVAKILENLLRGSEDDLLTAYQIAFDLYANDLQKFLMNINELLPEPISIPAAPDSETKPKADNPALQEAQAQSAAGPETSEQMTDESQPLLDEPAAETHATSEEVDEMAAAAAQVIAPYSAEEIEFSERLTRLKNILTGVTPIELSMRFLYHFQKTDLTILRNMKTDQDSRSRVLHLAVVNANAFMYAGTTVDRFLRENLDWLRKATNWAKFSTTASLGVIHRGHIQNARNLMAPYLSPPSGAEASPFPEGGALYAMGLIHVNHGDGIKHFLLERLRVTGNEVVQHGACLGLGLSCLGTSDSEVLEEIKSVLHTDSAVAGEAAGISMGLLLAGTKSSRAAEMLAYAHDTQHEKIIRGLAMGLSFLVYGCEEEADTLIEQMTSDQDPILRYGGMYAIAMAYRGTGNSEAIRKLLHFAVSDVSDDVRRAAVLCLGFILYSNPQQAPKTVALLAESYNPHVRYGAAMAVGISCAGFPFKEALDLVEPLLKDSVDFVRQGAFIAMAMLLMQTSEEREPRVHSFRRQIDKALSDKHEETMCKMGAILAAGILDAGGRNVTIALRSRTVFDRMTAIVGMAVFTQYWFWYPLILFVSLTFTPTAFIGLNKNIRVPQNFYFLSGAKESMFAYPKPVSAKSASSKHRVPSAKLSAKSSKSRRREKEERERQQRREEEEKVRRLREEMLERKKKEAADGASALKPEEDDAAAPPAPAAAPSTAAALSAAATKASGAPKPQYFRMRNPTRVVPAQEPFIKFISKARYAAVQKRTSGFVMLKDRQPGEPEQLADSDPKPIAPAAADGAAQAATVEAISAAAGAEEKSGSGEEQPPPPPAPFQFG